MAKHQDDLDHVLLFVSAHEGCTAKDVAIELFGGTGKTRTTERTRAHACLRELEEVGKLSAKTERKGDAARWYLYREPQKRKLVMGMCPHTDGNYCEHCVGDT